MVDPPAFKCDRHGPSLTTGTVCGHLVRNRGIPLGFIENSDDPGNRQGWCYACEFVFSQEQDKTDRFVTFCDFAVVCTRCYDEIKARHDFDATASPRHDA